MNKRLWGLVTLFAALVAMLGVWLLMSEDPSLSQGEPQSRAPGLLAAGPPKTRAIPTSAEHARLAVADVAHRQQRMTLRAQPPSRPAPPTETSGSFALDQEGLSAAVRERQADLEACYATARLHTPDLAGQMTLALGIEPEAGQPWGRVTAVDSDVAADASVLEGCIATVFEGLRFEAAEPVTVRYPIHLTGGRPDPR